MGKKQIVIAVLIVMALVAANVIFLMGKNYTWKPGPLDDYRAQYCQLLGGTMRDTGCGIAGCAKTCRFPYRDGGKTCQSSRDCSGKCLLASPKIMPYYPAIKNWPMPAELKNCGTSGGQTFNCADQGWQGQCQSWPLQNCDVFWEYDHGQLKLVSAECRM